MIRSLLPLLILSVSALAGCTSPQSEPAPTTSASRASEPAPAQAPAKAKKPVEVALSDLEGTWERDDGPRYLLVVVGDALLGRRLDDEGDELGCRVALERTAGGIAGQATFSRKDDETGLLSTAWELAPVPGALRGRVQGIDLDDDGNELGRSWDEHTWRRVARLTADEADAARKVADVDHRIDLALASSEQGALLTLFMAPEVQALEGVPGSERVAPRLLAIAPRALGSTGEGTLEASAPRQEEAGEATPTDEPIAGASSDEGMGDEPAKRPARPIQGSPDMAGFLKFFDGTDKGVTAALDAFGAEGLQRHEMDWFMLRDPKITATEKTADGEKVTLECAAGMTTRTYILTWAGDRIVEVVDGGMK